MKQLFGISALIAILGFFIDSDQREDRLIVNLFEIGMLALIIFVCLLVVMKLYQFISKKFINQH